MRMRSILAVVAAAALLPPAAAAQAPVVAENGAKTVTLRAQTTTSFGVEQVALTLRIPDGDSSVVYRDVEGEATVPVWADEAAIVAEPAEAMEAGQMRRVFFGGAVPAAAATVELGFGRAQPVRFATSESAAFTGTYAGRLRFFVGEQLVPAAIGEALEEDGVGDIRLYDAAGELIGVPRQRLPRRSVRLYNRRLPGGGRLRATAHLVTRLAPVPGQPARTHEMLCVALAGDSTPDGDSLDCQPPGPRAEQARLAGRRGCGAQPTTIAGILPTPVRTLVAVLGSGRRSRVATRPAPFGRPGRVVAAALPRGEALRRVLTLDSAGRVLQTLAARAAPPDRRCARGATDANDDITIADELEPSRGTPEGTQTAAALPGGPRIVMREQGEEICLGIDRLALDGSGCILAPFSSRISGLGQLRGPAGVLVLAGAFNARVASIELTLDDKRTLRLPTAAGTEYSGRWRETTRFVLTALPAGRAATAATLLDADGRPLGPAQTEEPDVASEAGRTLIRTGSARLRADRFRDSTGTYACLAPLFGRRYALADECVLLVDGSDSELFVAASCAPRTTLLGGFARRGVRRVEIRLTSGRVVRPRLVAVPGLRGRAFLVRTGVGVARVRFVGHRRNSSDGDTIATPLVSATKQCGYEFEDLLI